MYNIAIAQQFGSIGLTLSDITIDATLKKVRLLLDEEKGLSSALRSTIEMLLTIVTLLANRLGLNSSNSSKPPSTDPHRERKVKKKSDKKVGGQPGHPGSTLRMVEKPDEIKVIQLDKRTLPRGVYKDVGYEKRQVIDIKIEAFVTEYQAQILEDANGMQFVAPFPTEVTRPVQYGADLKAHSVYLSQYQLIPYDRIKIHFQDQVDISISAGSLCNFNQQAYELLEKFDEIAIHNLIVAPVVNADETGINVAGKTIWLHSASNEKWTHFRPHKKRGTEAMNDIGILLNFKGILCHDHFKPYFTYTCLHSLCNAHHLRELERVDEQDHHVWAPKMIALLNEMNTATHEAGGQLTTEVALTYRLQYRNVLAEGQTECPPPEKRRSGQRGRLKRSKARNLLERLINYEDDVLRFMENPLVPFTNNLGENDIRMTKVQQKISGCFRSMEGAQIFCRIRGYLSTCRKHGMGASEALKILFRGELPAFARKSAE